MDGNSLLAVIQDPGFRRLKRVPNGSMWELWLQDGVLHTLVGPTLANVVAQAEQFIARRGQP